MKTKTSTLALAFLALPAALALTSCSGNDYREDRRDDRQDYREDRRDDRQDHRDHRQDGRQDHRDHRQDHRHSH